MAVVLDAACTIGPTRKEQPVSRVRGVSGVYSMRSVSGKVRLTGLALAALLAASLVTSAARAEGEPTGLAADPASLASQPVAGTAYVANEATGTISVIARVAMVMTRTE